MRQDKYDCSKNMNQMQKDNRKDLKDRGKNLRGEWISDTLRIPMDVCTGETRVTITGVGRIWVENYKGILEYSDNHVLLQSKSFRIRIEGSRLYIRYYTCSDMLICGRIKNIQYLV